MAATKKKTKEKATKGTPLEKERFAASLAKHARLLDKLPKLAVPSRRQLEAAIAKAPPTFEAFLDARGRENLGAGELMLLLVAADVIGKKDAVVHRGDMMLEEPTIYFRDLHVKGSLTFSGNLFVLGDLVVDGVLREYWDVAHCLVAGSIRARGIKCGGTILSGAGIRAEAVFVELGGKLGATSGVEADLVIVEDRDVNVLAKVKAKQKVVLGYPDPKPLARLRSLLTPAAFGVVPGDDALYDYTNLMDALASGRRWAAGATPKAAGKKTTAKDGGGRYFELVEGTSKKSGRSAWTARA
jgi:hypothetical protein